MASEKRKQPMEHEPDAKKSRAYEAPLIGQPQMTSRVVLNPADCNLDFNIEGNGLQGSGLFEHGFAYCWSGARANVGIRTGRYCFSCKIIATQPVNTYDTPFDQQHICRIGISRGDVNVGNLGEALYSFGFEGTGMFSNAGKFNDYGESFMAGDTILCAVDLESKPFGSISFAKNGKWLGTAIEFNAGPYGLGVADSPVRELQWESAIFPHVLLKNVVVKLQFSFEDGLFPVHGYKPWASAFEDGSVIMGPTFSDLSECEVLMMVGLPASGKSTWAEKWVEENPHKRYVLIGTNLALDQMKVPVMQRNHIYNEGFDHLLELATGIFNTLLARASKIPRNFIIDQTNAYKNARKYKLKPFADYHKVAVVVFPKPEEHQLRYQKIREMGKEIPPANEMIAKFSFPKSKDMPGTDEFFDQVIFIELDRAESEKYLNMLKNLFPCESSGTAVQQSRGSSIQEHNNPSLQAQRPLSGKECQSSYPVQPRFTTLPGNGSSTSGFLPRDDLNHRRSYSGYNQTCIENESRSSTAVEAICDPSKINPAYGSGHRIYPLDNLSGTSFSVAMDYKESGQVDSYTKTSSGYNNYGGHGVPDGHQIDFSAPRPHTFPPPAPVQYGALNETSNPITSSGNYTMNVSSQFGGYAQPHPGYQ